MKISIIGSGYVGLVSGTCFSDTGNYVTCVDIDKDKVRKLSNGEITIFEPGLEKIFLKNIKEKRLKFTSNLEKGINDAEIIFLALPTPPSKDGHADLRYILEVANQLGTLIKDYKIIVDKSTVPVGTSIKVRKAIAKNCSVDFDVVSNPEFLREGVAVNDFMKPDRIVIGTKSIKARKILKELYSPFVRQGNPIIYMDENSAELTKYAANSFLATKISFMNEIALLCEKLDADVDLVRKGIGTDLRIGKRFLFPGIGYGGSCFPKDVKALIKSANEVKYDFKILNAVESVNEFQKLYIINAINKYFKQNIKGKHFALWGLSFKPNTDDIREAPSLVIIKNLLAAGASVSVFDPEAISNVKNEFGNKINYSTNMYDCLINADALIIATEWNEFRTPDFNKIIKYLKSKLIFDGRNLFDSKNIKEIGIEYFSVGRK